MHQIPCQLFFYTEEAEWAIEVMKATGKPVGMCMTINQAGDLNGVPLEECAVRIAKAGNEKNRQLPTRETPRIEPRFQGLSSFRQSLASGAGRRETLGARLPYNHGALQVQSTLKTTQRLHQNNTLFF